MLAFSWDGEIYTLRPGAAPEKVAVDIKADKYDADHVRRIVKLRRVNHSSVAFRRGGGFHSPWRHIYVTSVKYKTTKRITDTPAQERIVEFSPDGRTLVYDSERDGLWQLFTAKIKDDKEKSFAYATDIVEEPLYKGEKAAQQPMFSPTARRWLSWRIAASFASSTSNTKESAHSAPGEIQLFIYRWRRHLPVESRQPLAAYRLHRGRWLE